MYYIYEADKPNKLAEMFYRIKLEDNSIILPNIDILENEKVAYKLAIKTKTILDKTNSRKLVLSKKIKKYPLYLNYLYSYNYDIVEGEWLFKNLIFNILDYVIEKRNLDTENIKISILVNDISEFAIYSITKLIEDYKNVNIVTNYINKFEKIEDKIFQEDGILINVGNNKRKALSKSNIILNLDFPTELINRYNIKEDAVIINFRKNVKIKDKRFNGLNINNYEIDYQNEENEQLSEKFYNKDLYEALQYKNQPVEETLKKIKKDNIKIKQLIGENTVI